MTFVLYLVVYAAIGIAVALVLVRRESTRTGRTVTVVLSVIAWPLWAPIASRGLRDEDSYAATDIERRIESSLDEALAAVRGSSFATLLPEASVESIRASVRRAGARVAELTIAVARNAGDAEETRRRIGSMERDGDRSRSLTTARVHLDNLAKLEALLASERAALLELADLCDALRSQLVLARFAGSSVDGLSNLVSELDARVEGLDCALASVIGDVRLA